MRGTLVPAALRQLSRPGFSQTPAPGPCPRSPCPPGRASLTLGLARGLAPVAARAESASARRPRPAGGSGTGLPVPRYVSLKTDRVNLREGPSKDHRTAWVFQRAGLPVEIVAEYETWRRIRDSEGTEGWVLHSLLSGRRTALVMPWAQGRPACRSRSSTGPDEKGGRRGPAPARRRRQR